MNQYRVDLWIENQGDIPDKYFQFQMNAAPEPVELVMAALFLSSCGWVREASVKFFSAGQWRVVYTRSNIALCGSAEMVLLS